MNRWKGRVEDAATVTMLRNFYSFSDTGDTPQEQQDTEYAT